MPLTDKQITEIREELDHCRNPLFFFHDDPDGLSSYLLLYRYKQEGNGVIVKRATPIVDEQFLKKVDEYAPDKIFILDIAVVDQGFVDGVNVPVIWIDHHSPIKIDGAKIFNPRLNPHPDAAPVTYMCHQVAQRDLWIAMVGCVGDWFYPDFAEEFKKKYPELIKTDSKDPGEILFNTKLGTLVKIFSFILKGKTSDVKKCYKIMTRIESPEEILEQKSPQGKYLYKKFELVNQEYADLLKEAKDHVKKDKLLLYIYKENKMSFSGDLANELLFRYPQKLIIIGREKEDEVRMSLRYTQPLLPILNKALTGIDGYGGGHEYACGANIKKHHLQQFIDNIRKELEAKN